MGRRVHRPRHVSFRPPTEIERDQLKRYYKTESLAVSFDALVLLFADTTLVELAAQAKYAPGAIHKKAAPAIRKALDLLLDGKSMDINYSVGKTCLEGAANDLFFAYIDQTGGADNVIFEIDPFQTEQVQLWRPVKAMALQNRVRNREVICQFPLEAERERAAAAVSDDIPSYDAEHYRVLSRFDGALRLTGDTEVRFRSLEEGQNWLALALDPDLDVDAVPGQRRAGRLLQRA